MRYYQPEPKSKLKKRNRRSWSGASRYGSRKSIKIRHYEEAAFFGSSGLYRNQRTKPLHIKSFLLGLVVISWFGFLIYSPFFKITNVNYTGNEVVSKEQLEKIVNGHITSSNKLYPANQYFLLNTDKISNDLQNQLPIESVTVKKIFPNSLNVTITEKNSSIIYDNDESFYLLDSEGKLLKYLKQAGSSAVTMTTEITSTTTSTPTPQISNPPLGNEFSSNYPNLPIYYDHTKKIPTKNDSVLSQKAISNIIDFDRGIRQGTGLKIIYFTPDYINTDLVAVTGNNWLIKFTTDRSIESQLAAFTNIFKSINPTEYIDVRLEDRLFWK